MWRLTMQRPALALGIGLFIAGCSEPALPPPDEASWSQLFSKLPGALISVWGTTAADVWTVGGDPGDGDGPMVMHYDGQGWSRRLTGHKGDLWWVHGFAGGPIFMGGADGAILRYQDGKFETMSTPAKAGTVFGIWGDAPNNLYAVGGAGGTPTGGFIWRYDGTSWSPDPRAPKNLDAEATVFKAWGTGPKDVWLVGSQGLVLHDDGDAITLVPTPTDQTLFTVSGTATRAYAVGGDGTLLENDGDGWHDAAANNAQQMNGVAARADAAYAAGVFGGVLRRAPSGWVKEDTGIEVQDDFHGVWLDPDGGVWCAGGQVAAFPLLEGLLLYRGKADIPGSTFETVK